MPTGLTNSPGIIGLGATALQPSNARGAINKQTRVILATTGVAQVSQPINVDPGANVFIRANNGSNAGNAAPIRVALSCEALALGSTSGDTITPDTEITYPVDNTGQIWVRGTAGDGAIISVRANAIS